MADEVDTEDIPAGEGMAIEERIRRAYALAHRYERDYGGCAQCVLAAIQDVFGIVGDAVFKSSQALAGGGALSTRGTCGALSGGLIAISCKYGRDRDNFASRGHVEAYKLGKRLYDKFVAEYGSPTCADVQTRLLGRSFDLWSKEDYKALREASANVESCITVVGKVAMWTAEVLLEREEEKPQS